MANRTIAAETSEKLKLTFESFDKLVKSIHPGWVCEDCVFLWTSKKAKVGSKVLLEMGLANLPPLIRAVGTVLWIQRTTGPPGLAFRFVEIDASSRQLVESILSEEESPVDTSGEKAEGAVPPPSIEPCASPEAASERDARARDLLPEESWPVRFWPERTRESGETADSSNEHEEESEKPHGVDPTFWRVDSPSLLERIHHLLPGGKALGVVLVGIMVAGFLAVTSKIALPDLEAATGGADITATHRATAASPSRTETEPPARPVAPAPALPNALASTELPSRDLPPGSVDPASESPGDVALDSVQQEVDAVDQEVDATVRAWARAWTEQRVEDYLAFYAESFSPPGQTREVWKKERRSRIRAPRRIEVALYDLEVEVLSPDEARASFRQTYVTEKSNLSTWKTLRLSRRQAGWKIHRENRGR